VLSEPGIGVALVLAVLLGLRHATDPDHLTAVSMLVLRDRDGDPYRAAKLGLAWGLGHATTLLLCGLPLVILGRWLPVFVQRWAETLAGVTIVFLSARLLVRWWTGSFHVHAHRHGKFVHAHPHAHEDASDEGHLQAPHHHEHAEGLGRSPLASFGIGMAHGVGGSAGAGLLVIAALPAGAARAVGLIAFACGTAVAMVVVSFLLGAALARVSVRRCVELAMPWVGVAGCLGGGWYVLAALGLVS
jgi:cytochrome c biogenesis protein CcdA